MLAVLLRRASPRGSLRCIHSTATRLKAVAVERPSDEVDVCIVGGGPAGLSAAIRLKQLERESGKEIRVVVLEKGPEIGLFPQCFIVSELNVLS